MSDPCSSGFAIEQSRLLGEMVQAGALTAERLQAIVRVEWRTAYRMLSGERALTVEEFRALIAAPDLSAWSVRIGQTMLGEACILDVIDLREDDADHRPVAGDAPAHHLAGAMHGLADTQANLHKGEAHALGPIRRAMGCLRRLGAQLAAKAHLRRKARPVPPPRAA